MAHRARRLVERARELAPGPHGEDRREAERRHRSRPMAERLVDESRTAEVVVEDPDDWEPRRNDLAHVDTGPMYGRRPGESEWRALERQASIAPPHGRPTTDPAGDMLGPAVMCGWAPGAGYDSLQGVDRMATGEADAMAELDVESATPGGPLELGPHESAYDDRAGAGTHGTAVDTGPDDWTWALRMHGGEPEARAGWL